MYENASNANVTDINETASKNSNYGVCSLLTKKKTYKLIFEMRASKASEEISGYFIAFSEEKSRALKKK